MAFASRVIHWSREATPQHRDERISRVNRIRTTLPPVHDTDITAHKPTRAHRAGAQVLIALAGIGAVALSACSSSHAAGQSPSGPVKIALILPISGAMGELGPLGTAVCSAATYEINAAGGILGRKATCVGVDDTGDPADAVPNVTRAIATNNFSFATGFDTNTAEATFPLTSRAHIPSFADGGSNAFDQETDPYFWRTLPDDKQQGEAFVVWAAKKQLQNIAVVLLQGPSTQGNAPGIVQAASRLGVNVDLNVTIPPGASSYASTVERVIRAHPDGVIFEADTQTAATFFGEYSNLNNGQLPYVVTGTDVFNTDYYKAMVHVIGPTALQNNFAFVGSASDVTEDGYKEYVKAVNAGCACKDPASVIGIGGLSSTYDAVIIGALAMDAAHSTNGPTYNKSIPDVTTASPDAVVVRTYAAGLAALNAGKKIQFIGAEGPIAFNGFHNSPGSFFASGFTNNGASTEQLGAITLDAVQ